MRRPLFLPLSAFTLFPSPLLPPPPPPFCLLPPLAPAGHTDRVWSLAYHGGNSSFQSCTHPLITAFSLFALCIASALFPSPPPSFPPLVFALLGFALLCVKMELWLLPARMERFDCGSRTKTNGSVSPSCKGLSKEQLDLVMATAPRHLLEEPSTDTQMRREREWGGKR